MAASFRGNFGTLLCVAMTCCVLHAQTGIALRHGMYVVKGNACKDAPFAVLTQWDGVGFSGAHSSHCTTKVLAHYGQSFRIATTCAALGDGTPTAPDVENATLQVLGAQAFRYTRQVPKGKDVATYLWCSAGE